MSDLTDLLRYAATIRLGICEEAANEIDRLTAERDALREQLALAESVRAAQVAGLTEGAEKLREEVARLTKIIDDAWGEA